MMNKELYKVPSIIVVEVKFKGIVCASGSQWFDNPGYGDVNEI